MIKKNIEIRIKEWGKKRNEILTLLAKDGYVFEQDKDLQAFKEYPLNVRILKKLKVACIMDRFTLDCYAPECNLLELSPLKWKEEVDSFQPDMLFIESAWKGKDELWYRKIDRYSDEVFELCSFCKAASIPVIFWNKEDPVYTDSFMTTASYADFVFTTDIDCIAKYKTTLKHDRVYHLHFAAQPKLHNPIEKFDRKDSFCFAGAYYHRYKNRADVFDSFSEIFIQTKGLDIYDRNFRNALPEHAFPERYNQYILGNLDPSEIDKAYKGYTFGVNMNSISQSQTMFARRVFELMASNTVTVGNYSRGLKNYFGDLTICTDDQETLKQNIQDYCGTEQDLRKYRLLGLRKILTENLYEDRLSYIVEKVFSENIKTQLPLVTVLVKANTEQQIERSLRIFNLQTYVNKRIIFITDEMNIAEPSESVNVFKTSEISDKKIFDLVNNGYIAFFDVNDWYGSNYLLDLLLTTRYGNYNVIGKALTYLSGENLSLAEDGTLYRPALALPAHRSVIRTELIGGMLIDELDGDTIWTYENMFTVDEFNYCENWQENNCPLADDMFLPDTGISMASILKTAENISSSSSPSGNLIIDSDMLAKITYPISAPITVSRKNNKIIFSSKLKETEHSYAYFDQFYELEDLLQDGLLKVTINGTGKLDLSCACVFYNNKREKINAQFAYLRRKNTINPQSGAYYVKFGLRTKGTGSCELISIIIGENEIGSGNFLSRSGALVLTNQYPSPQDLYRNMFVHKRVICYKEEGHTLDVMRMNIYAKDGYSEFEGINIVEGQAERLAGIMATGSIHTVCVHFLDQDMWNVLKLYSDKVRIFVWVHGSEIQPWWRREFNYTNQVDLNQAKVESNKRMAFWSDVFSNLDLFPVYFIFVSEYFSNEIFEDNKKILSKDYYSIIPNFIDTSMFSYSRKDPEQRTKILSIRPYASNKYANDLTVKCIEQLAKKPYFKNLEFRLIGSGELFDSILHPLRKYTNVTLEKTFLRQDAISELHKSYGIFLTPTRMDAQGVSRDEAMSSGLVPVTNKITAIPEFVDETCGILAPGEDYLAMADGIDRLYRDPDLFLRMSENAANRVKNQSSKKHTIEKEIKLIQNQYKHNTLRKRRNTVSIFGSCVTRDCFRIASKKSVNLVTYIARQSIISAVSAPLSISPNDIQLDSDFQKSMVLTDIKKETFSLLGKDGSESLIIDLIDERFQLADYKNTYLTYSNELKNSRLLDDNPKLVTARRISSKDGEFELDGISLEVFIREFCRRVKEIYPEENIIIHEVYPVDHYLSTEGQVRDFTTEKVTENNRIRTLISYMYLELKKNMPMAKIINKMDICIASETHYWGLAPVHYTDNYYQAVMDEFCRILLVDE